ncbi:hypothetical protein HBI70_056750 [Parastagonospora nodorum]|nr:hypothetical protein HBI74_136970 [Parastagonospora nodorum]KAH5121360.1 hypothetical protein HBH71_056010 [Parastagonospora nodorum]KAH5284344.1 hypothetical protein HBI70_056750 [Parastagonospora nodorum]KAH5312746.1 hypothetical protein HBI11_088690 [Parastagonospora nodorum]KAH6370551.1 hypothetical protein HBI34_111300 [Parastagonospora nodorum]
MAARKSWRGPSVHAELQSLGLRSYTTSARAVFKHEAVNRLYREELPSLFRILVRDQGSTLDRDDPALFDKELDQLLREYGPLIWPGEGSRNHLLTARFGTPYESDLVYPRDSTVLKSRLRRNILVKKIIHGVDYQAQMENAGGSESPAFTTAKASSQTTPMRTLRRTFNEDTHTNDHPSLDDSVMGATRRQQTIMETDSSYIGFSHVQLRLYRKIKLGFSGTNGPVFAFGSMLLKLDGTTSHDCFHRVCERISTDCNLMVFHFPEDMYQAGSIRLDRGSADSDATFQRVLSIFRNARKFPGDPQYRSLEVEVGLDFDDNVQGTITTPTRDGSSSPLSSAPSSPRDSSLGLNSLGGPRSPRSVMRERSVASRTAPIPLDFECFSHFSNGSGHYYSAPKLYARGIWIGYLSPESQKNSYRGLPSFRELQANFRDMSLPFPPSTLGSSGMNRDAVCRGCFGAQSGLFTLREMAFVKDRSLAIMPLDGNEEMGMFCILISQPMDRSTKHLQVWRPYEVGNGGDGLKFSNSFALLTLRYTGLDIGTIETIRATLHSPGKSNLVSRSGTNTFTFQAPMKTLSAQVVNQEDDTDGPLLSDKPRAARKRKPRAPIERKPSKSKRNKTGTSALRLSISQDALRSLETPLVDQEKELQAAGPPNSTKEQPALIANIQLAQKIPTVVESQASLSRETPFVVSAIPQNQPILIGNNETMQKVQKVVELQASLNREAPPVVTAINLTDEQAQNINIVWTVDVDGAACDFSLTMAECHSFSKMLGVLRDMVQSFPDVAAILENANMWLLTYMGPKGAKKTQLGRKGTEVAFNRMRDDLAKTSSTVGGTLDVELRAV